MLRIRIAFFLLLSVMTPAAGFHIAGGDFTAQWMGGQTFRVKLTLFRDCSNAQGAPFDNNIIIGIYRKSDNQLQDSLHMDLNSVTSIGLTGSSCVPPPNVCMEVGDYLRDIQLPDQPGGYYLVWERCCRNSDVLNISDPDDAGMAFYLEIADPALQNSSPVFNSAPSPYSCAQQLFSFPFDANDADGDSLVYELTTPLAGGHTWNQNPNPFSTGGGGMNIPPDPAPYSSIVWSSPFSLSNLTDGSIPVTINPQTGLLEGSADVVGLYAIAVTVHEYRNGVLIGSVRREIQFTIIPCDGNVPPAISSSFGQMDTTIYAGDTLCFTVVANDPEGDTLSLTHSGELFAGDLLSSITAPYAQSSDTAGVGSVSAGFCWFTSCNQSRDLAYKIQYEARDNGCPLPATQRKIINITVKAVPEPPRLNLLCMRLLSKDIVQVNIAPDTSLEQRFFSRYNIYRSKNGDAFQLLAVSDQYNLQQFTDSTAIDNDVNNYCYTISGVNRCNDEGGLSDTLCSFTSENTQKNYLRTVSVEGNREVRIAWEDFADGPFSIYHLYRRENSDGILGAEVATLQNYYPMQYIDRNVNVSASSYCYTLVNEDVCGNLSPVSDELCTILLKGNSETFLHRLNWNEFSNWRGGTDRYETERMDAINGNAFELLLNTPAITAEDKDIPVSGGLYAYRIRAKEGAGSYGEESLSNEITLQQLPLAWVPNAFTPNRDGNNDSWGVETAFVEEIELAVFNRWGQEVFRTGNKNTRWDGTYNGTEAPQSVYYYQLTFKGYSNEKKLRQSGIVTLIR